VTWLTRSWRQWLDAARLRANPEMAKNALAAATPAGVLLVLSKPFMRPPFGYDEQFFVWGGWSILKGLVPYKDFLEFKPPISFLTHALALKIFGFENDAYRRFFLIFAVVAISAWQVALLSRRVDRVLAVTLSAGLVYLFTHPRLHDTSIDDTESIGFCYFFIGAAFLIARTESRRLFDIIGGAFFALCVLSKEPFAPSVLPAWVACFLSRGPGYPGHRSALRYLQHTATGVAAIVVALCVYMIPSGAMRHYLAMLGQYKAMFRDPTQSYCVVLGMFRPRGSILADLPAQWEKISTAFFNVTTLGFLTPFFVAALVFTWHRSKALWVAALAALVGGMYTTTISNCYWPHYYVMSQTGMFVFLAIGLIAMASYVALRRAPARHWVRLVAVVPVALTVWPSLKTQFNAVYPQHQHYEPIPGVFEFVKNNSTPEDRIFTTGAPGLYVITDRIPASRTSSVMDEIINSYPGATDREKLRPMYDELVEHMPKIVILDPERGHRKVRYLAAAVMPFLTDYGYQPVNSWAYLRP
jgi:hypothetical protein